ncbi:unnamed protein product [Discosporangium mesarthrocarpum]
MIIVGMRESCDALSKALSFEFPTNNLGPLSLNTGCVFARDWERGQLLISQTAFVNQLCERFDVCSSSPTPAASNAKLLPRQDGDGAGNGRFRELIGVIWVGNMTRPDISNKVRSLTTYSQDPSREHWKGPIRVLQYLHRSHEQGRVSCRSRFFLCRRPSRQTSCFRRGSEFWEGCSSLVFKDTKNCSIVYI